MRRSADVTPTAGRTSSRYRCPSSRTWKPLLPGKAPTSGSSILVRPGGGCARPAALTEIRHRRRHSRIPFPRRIAGPIRRIGTRQPGRTSGSKVRQRFEKPQLMALTTDDDEPIDWLRAGEALQRALLTGTWYSASAPYGRTARYHAPSRYGVPARRHLLRYHAPPQDHAASQDHAAPQDRVPARRHLLRRDELAPYGLSASPLTESLEWDDIHGKNRRLPWRWWYADLPQMIVRVGYAAVPSKGEVPPKTQMGARVSQPRRQPPLEALSSPDSPQP